MRTIRTYLPENGGVDAEFGTKGHASIKVQPNDPRFGDNPLVGETELDEFFSDRVPEGRAILDRLHDIFRKAGVSDVELKQGLPGLTDAGYHKIAARLGISPNEVKGLLPRLKQYLSDESASDVLAEAYRQFIAEDDEDADRPFDPSADADPSDHLSAEPDYVGDITVSSSKTGNSRYIQGTQAADLNRQLGRAKTNAEKQAILRPLVEDDDEMPFADEITADAGRYNFLWKLDGQTGFATMSYALRGGKPALRLVSVRDQAGDEVDLDSHQRNDVLKQGRNFIGDA